VFGIGLPELAVIAFVALLVAGPEKLPGLAKQAGSLLRSAKRFTDGARDELREQLGPDYADLELTDLHPRTLARKHLSAAMRDDEQEVDGDVDDDLDDDDVPERVAYRKEQLRR
jgi:sec-independent protein translocase protein TatB